MRVGLFILPLFLAGCAGHSIACLDNKARSDSHRTHRRGKRWRSSARPRKPLPRSTMHDAARMAVRNRKRTSVAVPILIRKGELALPTCQGRLELKFDCAENCFGVCLMGGQGSGGTIRRASAATCSARDSRTDPRGEAETWKVMCICLLLTQSGHWLCTAAMVLLVSAPIKALV